MNVLSSFRGDRCGIDNCRSRRYHRAEDGLVYCQNGHQSSATFEVELDNDYVEASQATTRAGRSSPVSSGKTAFLSSDEAATVYLQCVQFVLQSQVQWVCGRLSSSDKLESIVKDLWALHLQILGPSITKALSPQGGEHYEADDPALLATSPSLSKVLSLLDCCALIYLGCLVLRLPVALRHVLEWIKSDTFPFIATSALIPPSLFTRLPLAYRRTFHTRTGPPDLGVLHRTTLRLAKLHAASVFSVEYPPLNYHLLLFEFLTELSLPLDLYPATLKLADLLDSSFTFPPPTENYVFLVDHPELQLLAILLATTKLAHPFDTHERVPVSYLEGAALRIDWRQWSRLRAKGEMTATQREAAMLELDDRKVATMDGDDIDEYLDWFQTIWIDEQLEDRGNRADFRRQLGQMFPLQDPGRTRPSIPIQTDSKSIIQQNVRRVQGTLQLIEPMPAIEHESSILRPGQKFAHYKRPEDLPGLALPFFEAASQLGAVTLEQLVHAVFHVEMRLNRMQG